MSKRNISYTQQDEPAFLKRFKEKIGYKEGPDINAKRCVGPPEDGDSDGEERDDEQPVIVVLKKGDLDADEVARLGGDSSKDTSAGNDEAAGGRIMFKKPKKTTTESNSELKKSSSSKSKETDHSSHSKRNKTKTLKNTNLLSFTEDEECDD
ncbi:hypothetical protein NP493_119g10009 [Ridgeia piscesae]|uniref:DUF4604 domain-containing protein n=1 Tax=Ridgeia piscesae TaxID=27915 RepID=A0AAD9P6C5_RIDPI|nr:hypothetical protein NP493_119g10009 [Ridgeia piscesae]